MKATMSFKDKLIDYRNRYRKLKGNETKGNFLSRLTDTFGFDRKYLIKLLNGQRDFKPPRGRGRTYGKEVERLALKLRKAAADPCAPYFIEMLPQLVADWEALKGPLDGEVRGKLLSASVSTVARWFRKHPSKRIRHGNRRSGANRIRDAVPCCPGLAIEDGAPGVVQVDAGRIAELENLRDKINVIHLVAKIKSLVKTVVDNANNARGGSGLAPKPLASRLGV